MIPKTKYDPIAEVHFIQEGSLKKVVYENRVISEGYHEFYRENGCLTGKIGATTERVFYRDKGRIDDENRRIREEEEVKAREAKERTICRQHNVYNG